MKLWNRIELRLEDAEQSLIDWQRVDYLGDLIVVAVFVLQYVVAALGTSLPDLVFNTRLADRVATLDQN